MFNKGIMHPTSLLIHILIINNKASCQMAKFSRFIKFRLTRGWGNVLPQGPWTRLSWAISLVIHSMSVPPYSTHKGQDEKENP